MKENKFEFLGEELYKVRKQKGLSQEELANKIDVSRQSIHLWEAGKSVPDFENIANLCNVLEISPENICNGFELIKERRIKKKNIIKMLSIILICILLIYILLSIRKSIILLKLRNNFSEYMESNNFYYSKTVYEEKNLSPIWSYTQEIYYKDGIYKREYSDSYGNATIDYTDINKNEKYTFDEIKKTCRIYENYDASHLKDAILISETFPSRVYFGGNEEKYINFLYGFKPTLRIESKKDKYNMYWSTEVRDYKENVVERVDKETGLLDAEYKQKNNGVYTSTEYKIENNSVIDEDIKLPNIDNYTITRVEANK